MDVALEHLDLPVIRADQLTQRLHPDREVPTQVHLIELTRPGDAEHVGVARQHAFFGHHRMHLRLEARPQLHQLGAVTHQLAQLPDRRRRDPRLRQPPQAQHVGQVGRVDHIVLDPPLTPIQRLRARQMHLRTQLLSRSTAQYQP